MFLNEWPIFQTVSCVAFSQVIKVLSIHPFCDSRPEAFHLLGKSHTTNSLEDGPLIQEQLSPFSLTIRISLIPAAWSKVKLCEILNSLYKEDPHGGEAVGAARNTVKILSLANDPRDSNYKMATSTISPLPGPLETLRTATCHGITDVVSDFHIDTVACACSKSL